MSFSKALATAKGLEEPKSPTAITTANLAPIDHLPLKFRHLGPKFAIHFGIARIILRVFFIRK